MENEVFTSRTRLLHTNCVNLITIHKYGFYIQVWLNWQHQAACGLLLK